MLLKLIKDLTNRCYKVKPKIEHTLYVLEKAADNVYRGLWRGFKISLFVLPLFACANLMLQKNDRHWNLRKPLLDQKYTGPSREWDETLNRPVIRIVAKDKSGEVTSMCSAVVISDYYALTAGHCVINDEYTGLTEDTFEIYNDEAKLVTTAKAAGCDFRPDLGILRGDFSMFNQLAVRHNETFVAKTSGKFMACGFPKGSKQAFCEKFIFQAFRNFSIAGASVLIPGMSGGPLIDTETKEVVGINVSVSEGPANANSSLLIGFPASFEIEP